MPIISVRGVREGITRSSTPVSAQPQSRHSSDITKLVSAAQALSTDLLHAHTISQSRSTVCDDEPFFLLAKLMTLTLSLMMKGNCHLHQLVEYNKEMSNRETASSVCSFLDGLHIPDFYISYCKGLERFNILEREKTKATGKISVAFLLVD